MIINFQFVQSCLISLLLKPFIQTVGYDSYAIRKFNKSIHISIIFYESFVICVTIDLLIETLINV